MKSFLAALPVLPWNDYSPGSIKGGVFASVSETFPLRKSIMLLWRGSDHKSAVIHLMKAWSSPFLLFCISPAEELRVRDAFGVEKWNIHLLRSASKGLLVVFAALAAPLKAFSIPGVQLSSSSIQNLWAGAQGRCGFAFLGHRGGSAVRIRC